MFYVFLAFRICWIVMRVKDFFSMTAEIAFMAALLSEKIIVSDGGSAFPGQLTFYTHQNGKNFF